MTTPADRLLSRVRRRLASLQPAAVEAYLRGLRNLAASVPLQELERAVSAAFKEAASFSGRRMGVDAETGFSSVAEYASTRRAAERLEAFQAELAREYAHVPMHRRTLESLTASQRARLSHLQDVYDAHVEANRKLLPLPDLEELAERFFSDDAIDRAFSRFRAVTQDAARDGVTYFARDIPGVGTAEVRGPQFGVLQPRVLDAIRTVDDRVMQRLRPEIRDSVRAILAQAYEAGDGPRRAAVRLRGLIGLSPSELAQVENFRAALKGAAGRDWRGYTARDKRFDRTIERALAGGGLDDVRIDKYVEAYARRRLALSAESHARTTLLNANKLAQHASWQTAVEGGIVVGSLLVKERLTVGDSRVREAHAAMRGETVPYDQPYSDGSIIPGEFDWNCRCWSRYYMRRA